MKFGQNFQLRVVPEWSHYYVDYNLLKRLTKPALDQSGLKVYSKVEASINVLESFFELRFHFLDTAERELCGLFNLNSQSSTIPEVVDVCPLELTLLLEAFLELQQDLKKTQWFERVNTDAIERILGKLERRGQGGRPVYRDLLTRWQTQRTSWATQLHTRLDKLNDLIADANRGLAPPQRTTGKSLYLARALGHWPPAYSDKLTEALQRGDSDFVVEVLSSKSLELDGVEQTVQNLACDLLRFSVMLVPGHAKLLLTLLPSPERLIVEKQVIKWFILATGRRQRLGPSSEALLHPKHHASIGVQPLPYIFQTCTKALTEVLLAKDDLGRLPLHYAARYELPEICQKLVLALSDGPEGSLANTHATASTAILCSDAECVTPLHVAVAENRTLTVGYLTEALTKTTGEDVRVARELRGDLLHIALRNQNARIFQELQHGPPPPLDRLSIGGQTPLHVAVQLGDAEHTSRLLNIRKNNKQEIDAPDTRGWTPLFQACADGHHDIVKLLLEAGSSQEKTDDLGWTAKEYAALKGHLAVADLFELSGSGKASGGPTSSPGIENSHQRPHCGEDERIIIANLGIERLDRIVPEVNLSYCSSVYTPRTYEGLSYVLEISAPQSTAEARSVRLPILDDQINDPFVFPIPATVEPQLVFTVIRVGAGVDGRLLVGSGTALLEGNSRQFGAGRQSLIREQTIPILDRSTMSAVGNVTFTFLVVSPFSQLQKPRDMDLERKAVEPPLLVGHRGLGQNLKTHEYLQIGENTVESFVSAAKLGASFVEFDVQITKDLEAVIFHDFSLSESGTDVPVHDLTLDQFLYASNIQSPHGNPLSVLGPIHSREDPSRKRSRSVGRQFEAGAIQVRDRMKHTVDFKLKGFKPNTRGDFIQDSFATLKELLAEVPEDVGFDIEIKYPRLHEAVDAGVAPVAIELNSFVDVALEAIHRHAGRRQIILSSFTPEICILLSAKQKAYPVFFITNAGKVPMSDMERRAASVQVAVRFAQRWNLAGVVFACEALLLCPRLVGFVKTRGLVCATYGTLNNEPENVRIQAEAGVDIIIADRVGLIAKALAALPVPN